MDSPIVTKDLLKEFSQSDALEYIDSLFDYGKIFPYNGLSAFPVEVLFNNLRQFRPQVEVLKSPYRLNSYFPKYNSYLPASFRDKYVVVKHNDTNYDTTDVITDLFVEPLRIQAKRIEQKFSLDELWKTNKDFRTSVYSKVLQFSPIIDNKSVREAIYTFNVETGLFNVSWAVSALILIFKTTKLDDLWWLDISAGWGDRLITSCAKKMNYVSCDPNLELKPYHDMILEKFSKDGRHREIIYEPFETADIPIPQDLLKQTDTKENPGYDVVLSSPPFFNLEVYSASKTQSYNKFPTFNDWMSGFQFPSLIKAWSLIKTDGFLALYIGDSKGGGITMCEATMFFIEKNLEGSSYEGIIGLQGGAGFYRPLWVWKKVLKNKKVWVPTQDGQLNYDERNLKDRYPQLYKNWMKASSGSTVKKGRKGKSEVQDVHQNNLQDSKMTPQSSRMKDLLLFSMNSKGLKLSDLTNQVTEDPNKKLQRMQFERSLLQKFSQQKIVDKGPEEDSESEDPFDFIDENDINKYSRELINKIRDAPKGKVVDVSNINSTGGSIHYIVSPHIKQKSIGPVKIQSSNLPVATTNLKAYMTMINLIPGAMTEFKEDVVFMKNHFEKANPKKEIMRSDVCGSSSRSLPNADGDVESWQTRCTPEMSPLGSYKLNFGVQSNLDSINISKKPVIPEPQDFEENIEEDEF